MSGSSIIGLGRAMSSIRSACVIGGVSLKGGRGSILGGLAGAAIIMVIANEVLLFGLPIQIQIIIKGAVIVIAAALYARRM